MFNIFKKVGKKINRIEWIFFDVGSTLMYEEEPFKRKFEEIAKKANVSFEDVYEE